MISKKLNQEKKRKIIGLVPRDSDAPLSIRDGECFYGRGVWDAARSRRYVIDSSWQSSIMIT